MVLATGCTQTSQKNDTQNSNAFFKAGFSGFSERDSIIIKAVFSECGEWGGHEETIVISLDKDKMFYATYRIYPFNCDSIDYYYGNTNLNPTISQRTILTENGKASIVDYIHRLTKSKITEEYPGHAGNFFSLINSDSSLLIQVYDSKEYDVQSFRQLVTEVF